MSARSFDSNGVLRERYDDATHTVTTFDEFGNEAGTRSYTPAEVAAAHAASQSDEWETARLAYIAELAAGLPVIEAARDAAQADANGHAARRAVIVNQRDSVTAFTPSATYSAATITAIRDVLVAMLNREIAASDYRKEVDVNAVKTDNAILWLARLNSDALLDI
jgi:hypothetical protein